MLRRVAVLALCVAGLAIAGCGDDEQGPSTPRPVTLALDFQPNAVHAGIFAAQRERLGAVIREEGIRAE
jgi:ABC-type nitrate/sulfonate/bicarbonate transport system substrate-binding protein